MTKRCVVPNCKTGSRVKEKCSTFQIPRDIDMLTKWQTAIPGIIKLQLKDRVCEEHFKEEDVAHEWVKLDANGQVIAQVTYKKARLNKFAVPTRFEDVLVEKKNCMPQHEYAKRISNCKINSPDTILSFSVMKPSIQELSTSIDIPDVPLSVSIVNTDIGLSLSSKKILDYNPAVTDLSALQNPAEVYLPIEISELPVVKEENVSTIDDFSANVPEGWSWIKMRTEILQCTLFTYTIIKVENGEHCPIAAKSVTLDANGTLKYFVYNHHVYPQDNNLQCILKKKEMLRNILLKFKEINICIGLGNISSIDNLIETGKAYKDIIDKWRSKNCSLLLNTKRCHFCIKLRNNILRRKRRLNYMPRKRFDISDPDGQYQLSVMRMKMKRNDCKQQRAKSRVKHLTTYLKVQMKSMQNRTMDKKLIQLNNISQIQKLVIEEIVSVAGKNAKGRRYTDQWIMLCTLMNIRSPRDYEFLRTNNILPLPCPRTIRSYLSLNNI